MASVFQKCKRDVRDPSYPCERPRCGHRWTVRYREPGGRRGLQREKSFSRRVGLDGADAYVVHVENSKKSGTFLGPARGPCACRSGHRTGSSDELSATRLAATTRASFATTSCRAWDIGLWPVWRDATSNSSPRTSTDPVRAWRLPRSTCSRCHITTSLIWQTPRSERARLFGVGPLAFFPCWDGAGMADPSSPVITPAHPYRAGIVLGWDGNARAGFRTLCCRCDG